MKFRLTFKTPDVLDVLKEDDEDDEDTRIKKELARRYVKFGESITIEFDTEFETAVAILL